ncbi:MAG: ABC transporter permease [Micrococcales bacterium]|nr:MAG: ABC transporter permease [Micrococcales bacterium]PIE25890.1 MAG: ABC transporter permease [Micrococcales bacterium]
MSAETIGKFGQMLLALAVFAAVFGGILVFASLFRGRAGERVQSAAFVAPTLLLIAVGLLYPAALTIRESFIVDGSGTAGVQNYVDIFTGSENLTVLRNTALWVVLVPFFATALGLLYAILVDRSRFEAVAKALIFFPMAISMVGASIIWKFMYEYRPSSRPQIGVFNGILTSLGVDSRQFLLDSPQNTLYLIAVMVWIQAGFAMTVLSAAIKAIPDDILEAASLDGVSAWQRFRFVTLPSIRPAVVVVMITIAIGTLKVFDIVRTMTGGQFQTSVIANEFYNAVFRYDRPGLGAAFAVLLFILVIPIIVYNTVQMRKDA